MKECKHYKKLKNKEVQCQLCPRFCVIRNGKRGNCCVRENKDGKLFLVVYGKPCAVHVDPIEKKPLYYFLPGTLSFSVGTAGCNLHCVFCQNWEISQIKPEELPSIDLSPGQVVAKAIKHKCPSISYTYTEPLVAWEYVYDTSKEASKKGIKNVIVSNGYINEEPLKELIKYLDAANIDLKSFDEIFYKDLTGASLDPVLRTLKILSKGGIHLEVTTLVIPGKNDDMKTIEKMCKWLKKELGDVPLHLSRFFPHYKMKNVKITPLETLQKAKKVAEKYLSKVSLGNV